MVKNKHWGSSLDSFLKEAGIYEEVTAAAVKSVIADLLAAEMHKKGIAKKHMAEMMGMSLAQLNRFLDPKSESATLESLLRAARIAGRELHLALA